MSTLPKLPKQNKHREADFGVAFRHWVNENKPSVGSYELKDTKGADYLPFSAVEDRQVAYALRIEGEKGELIRVQGMQGEPDYIYLRLCEAFVVIKYPKFFCIIEASVWVHEKDASPRKSLTSARAKEIAVVTV